MAGEVTGNLGTGVVKNQHISASAAIDASKMATRSLVSFPYDLMDLRVWDAVEQRLPGSGNVEAAVIDATFAWDPNSADATFFTAVRGFRVVGITARVEVSGTDGAAVTAVVKKAASATAIASGTALHSSTLNLKGAAATNQSLSLSATSADLDIAAGTSIGIDFTGTLTSARGTVTVLMVPSPSADDLQIVTGTFGSGPPQVQSVDVKAAGSVTKRARGVMVLPDNYVTAGNVSIRCNAGMATTVADTSSTIVVEAYLLNADGTISSNLVSTSATSINSLTLANKDFTLDASSLVAGSRLDVRVSMAINDAASVTAVKGVLQDFALRCDVQP